MGKSEHCVSPVFRTFFLYFKSLDKIWIVTLSNFVMSLLYNGLLVIHYYSNDTVLWDSLPPFLALALQQIQSPPPPPNKNCNKCIFYCSLVLSAHHHGHCKQDRLGMSSVCMNVFVSIYWKFNRTLSLSLIWIFCP